MKCFITFFHKKYLFKNMFFPIIGWITQANWGVNCIKSTLYKKLISQSEIHQGVFSPIKNFEIFKNWINLFYKFTNQPT